MHTALRGRQARQCACGREGRRHRGRWSSGPHCCVFRGDSRRKGRLVLHLNCPPGALLLVGAHSNSLACALTALAHVWALNLKTLAKAGPPVQVTVLERTREAGKKVLMSGGTRCNVLPSEVDLQADFFTDSPTSAMRAIFASWGVWDCWAWLSDPEHVGLQLELEETSHKWFPASNSSKDVRDRLVAACECAHHALRAAHPAMLRAFSLRQN